MPRMKKNYSPEISSRLNLEGFRNSEGCQKDFCYGMYLKQNKWKISWILLVKTIYIQGIKSHKWALIERYSKNINLLLKKKKKSGHKINFTEVWKPTSSQTGHLISTSEFPNSSDQKKI